MFGSNIVETAIVIIPVCIIAGTICGAIREDTMLQIVFEYITTQPAQGAQPGVTDDNVPVGCWVAAKKLTADEDLPAWKGGII